MYVVVMMAVAEATGTGTLLGAFFTLVLYGLLPLGIVLYIFGTPGRRQMKRRRETEEAMAAASAVDVGPEGSIGAPDTSQEPAAARIAGVQVASGGGPETTAAAPPTASIEPDGRDHAAGPPVAPEGKEAERL
ncbi:MAG: hypothetical protein JWQ11_4165 [Rhizobacter sp.]|nr:hypothetical protein [Rhizobacter sp.]